jgi:hypothetical protein
MTIGSMCIRVSAFALELRTYSQGQRSSEGSSPQAWEERKMERRMSKCAVGIALILGAPGFAAAHGIKGCKHDMLRGQYVFTASGHTRASADSPWVPKAIVEALSINGDGTLTTPAVTVANPFGNSGAVSSWAPGSAGVYTVSDDCTGTLQFTPGPSFNIYVAPRGDEFWLMQSNPNNVFQGTAKRLW